MTQGDLFGDSPAAPAGSELHDLFADRADGVFPHRLLLASAGTGKTFQLANHFAGLLLTGVPPESILATTFTRKAAGEILDRVLKRLREGADDSTEGERTRAQIADAAETFAGAGVSFSPDHCRAALAQIVRAVDRFQVRTLDSFFIRLTRAFAAELDLRAEWHVTDEVEERSLRAEAIARILDDLDLPERLELVRSIAAKAGARETASALYSAVEVGDRKARLARDGAWRRVEPLGRPSETSLHAAAAQVRLADAPMNADGKTPAATWVKALARLADALPGSDQPWEGTARALRLLFKDGIAKKVAEWVEAGCPDTPPEFSRHPVEESLRLALAEIDQFIGAESVDDVIERNLANERLLQLYAAADKALRAELGAYRFEDFPLALLNGPVLGSTDQWKNDLAYRLDARIDHLLLDEFQDTSPTQWWLVAPLAEEIIADGTGERSFFCVGDVKQSIYGWRGGEPRLLSGLPARFEQLDPEVLTRSWRSSSVVLDAVNAVFDGIMDTDALTKPGRVAARDATEEWLAGFEPHVAARTELTGEATLRRARDKRDGETAGDPAVKLAVELVCQHAVARPDASIAVLVRAKKNIAQIRFLLKQAGVESSDEGGNPLTDSSYVTLVLALLQLGDHPADGVAALQVARAGFAAPFDIEQARVGTDDGRAQARSVSRAVRAAVLRDGYGGFCSARAREFVGRASAWDQRRLEQLIELGLAYDERASLRPIDFCLHVRSARVPDPTASRVKVMTIHASKGLEFDVVVLPELFKGIDLKPDGVLAHAPDVTAPTDTLTVTPTKQVAQKHEALGELYREAQMRIMTDALSALYVAMTRAARALELIVPALPKKGSREALTFANLCELPLVNTGRGDIVEPSADPDDESAPEIDHASLLWRHSDSEVNWQVHVEQDAHVVIDDSRPFALKAAPGGSVSSDSGLRAVVTPSRLGPDRGEEAGADNRGKRVGTLVHALLERVEWLDDGPDHDIDKTLPPSVAAAVLARFDRSTGGTEGAEALARVKRTLSSPGAAPLFTKPTETARALRERTFDVELTDTDTDVQRVRGAIDRVVLRVENGRIERALVIDFKTDATNDAQEVVRAHSAQIDAYANAAAELFSLPRERVTAKILWMPADAAPEVIATG